MRASRVHARGFTLIELMVAITILSMVAVLSWRGLDGMLRAQQMTQTRSDQLLSVQAGLGQWRADLDALTQQPGIAPLEWDGRVLRLTRRSAVDATEGLRVVGWSQRAVDGQTQWVRWQSPPLRTRGDLQSAFARVAAWARNPSDEEKAREVLVMPVAEWQIYYFRGNAWSSAFSSDGTAPKTGNGPPTDIPLPDGVRLESTLPSQHPLAGKLTVDWNRPTLSGEKLSMYLAPTLATAPVLAQAENASAAPPHPGEGALAVPSRGVGPCSGRPSAAACAPTLPFAHGGMRFARQSGAALLAAMLTVTLVATIASAAMWQQWRSVEVEAAERARAQDAWILTGALDWARLILREDGRAGGSNGADDLTEPWAIPLAESRLSTFLAAEGGSANDDGGVDESFLSGQVTDIQSRLNINNLIEGGKVSERDMRSFARLFKLLNIPLTELDALAENLRLASDTNPENRSGNLAPLKPVRLPELTWLGLSPLTLAQIAPYVTLLPASTPVNLNTASAQVIYAVIPKLDMAGATGLVKQRERAPFKTLTDVSRWVAGGELVTEQHSINTRFFEVRGRLRTPRGTVGEHSLLQRDGFEVTLLRRERVTPQALPTNPDGSPVSGGRGFNSFVKQ